MRKYLLSMNNFAIYISGISLIILMLITVIDIVGRSASLFHVRGIYELTTILVVIIPYFAFGIAEKNKDHVEIDYIYELLPSRIKPFVYLIKQLTYLFIVFLISWRLLVYALYMVNTGAMTSSLQLPLWPIAFMAFIGTVCFFFVVVYDTLKALNIGAESQNVTN